MAYSRRYINIILCMGTLLCSSSVLAADDDYLKMLEGEAEDVKLDQSGQLENKKKSGSVSGDDITNTEWKWEGDVDAEELPTGLAIDEFASLLKQHFYGTFVFYRKLNSNDQKTVYHHYKQATVANVDSIRKDILNQLKN